MTANMALESFTAFGWEPTLTDSSQVTNWKRKATQRESASLENAVILRMNMSVAHLEVHHANGATHNVGSSLNAKTRRQSEAVEGPDSSEGGSDLTLGASLCLMTSP